MKWGQIYRFNVVSHRTRLTYSNLMYSHQPKFIKKNFNFKTLNLFKNDILTGGTWFESSWGHYCFLSWTSLCKIFFLAYYVFMWTYSYSTVLAPKYVTVYTVLEKLYKMFSLQGGYYLHELFETEINGFFSQKL